MSGSSSTASTCGPTSLCSVVCAFKSISILMPTRLSPAEPALFQLKPRDQPCPDHTTMKEPRKILVIEDDAILRELLGDWLLVAGYRVALAAEGCAGVDEA